MSGTVKRKLKNVTTIVLANDHWKVHEDTEWEEIFCYVFMSANWLWIKMQQILNKAQIQIILTQHPHTSGLKK